MICNGNFLVAMSVIHTQAFTGIFKYLISDISDLKLIYYDGNTIGGNRENEVFTFCSSKGRIYYLSKRGFLL